MLLVKELHVSKRGILNQQLEFRQTLLDLFLSDGVLSDADKLTFDHRLLGR
jgi:hypothetical protein